MLTIEEKYLFVRRIVASISDIESDIVYRYRLYIESDKARQTKKRIYHQK